ncbi:MAG TPA: hypothetical protein DGM69_04170 [Chloroflexi bacterium]|nr:hypothetical protein [Chloroflexota bacterium]
MQYTGTTKITKQDISNAPKNNQHWKLIGTLTTHSKRYTVKIQLELLESNDTLYSISGATNTITYNTKLLKVLTLIGLGDVHIETNRICNTTIHLIYLQ